MKPEKPYYKVFTPTDILEALSTEFSDWLHTDIYNDIQTLDRKHGLGIFIRDNLVINDTENMSIAVVCEWKINPVQKDKVPKFLKYHIYKGDIPDDVLDEINIINEKTINPVWKK